MKKRKRRPGAHGPRRGKPGQGERTRTKISCRVRPARRPARFGDVYTAGSDTLSDWPGLVRVSFYGVSGMAASDRIHAILIQIMIPAGVPQRIRSRKPPYRRIVIPPAETHEPRVRIHESSGKTHRHKQFRKAVVLAHAKAVVSDFCETYKKMGYTTSISPRAKRQSPNRNRAAINRYSMPQSAPLYMSAQRKRQARIAQTPCRFRGLAVKA